MPTILLALRSDGPGRSCFGSPRRGEARRTWLELRRTSGKTLRPCSPISAAARRWMLPRPILRAATSSGTPRPHDVP